MKELTQMTFDYSVLDTETTSYLQQSAQETRLLLKRTTEDIIKIGQNLLEAKKRLPHGQFVPWVKVELGISQPTAWRFMQTAQGKEVKKKSFTVNDLVEQISAPTIEVEANRVPNLMTPNLMGPMSRHEFMDKITYLCENIPLFHELKSLIPPMQQYEYVGLVESIRKRGLHTPLMTYRGKIIDGRMRYLACLELGIFPPTWEWDKGEEKSSEDILRYIWSVDVVRSHYTPDQKAIFQLEIDRLERKLEGKKEEAVDEDSEEEDYEEDDFDYGDEDEEDEEE